MLQDPAISPAAMMRQYSMFSNYTAFDGDPPLTPSAARMLSAVEAAGLAAGRVFDIGAATGSMLWHFRQRGWAVSGCDPSPLAAAQARALNGVELAVGTGEETLAETCGLDLITMSHVLEHIYDPPALLATVRAALGDEGRLLIEVPCLTAPERNPPGLFAVEHINYFDAASLENLLRISGFAVEQARVELNHFPFPTITVLAAKAKPAPREAIAGAAGQAMAFCRDYLVLEQASWDALDARMAAAVGEGEPVYIWGAGVHTSMLLARTGLARRAEIVAATDRDPQKHGHALGRVPVVPPAEALESGRKIIISSYVSEAAIANGLKAAGVADRRIVRLYT